VNTGDLRGLARVVDAAIDEADRRDDVYATNVFRCEPSVFRNILRDDPDAAHRALDRALDGWPARPVYLSHYQVGLGRAIAYIYAGAPRAAARTLDELMPELRDLLVTHMPFLIDEVHWYRGRAALLSGDADKAEESARQIARHTLATARGAVPALRAPLALLRGDRAAAEALLGEAALAFTEAGMRHLTLACNHRRTELTGGPAADEARAALEAWMHEQGVAAPAKMLRFLLPGFD
jgi:hypothetical protein